MGQVIIPKMDCAEIVSNLHRSLKIAETRCIGLSASKRPRIVKKKQRLTNTEAQH